MNTSSPNYTDANCEICGAENLRDYRLCVKCERLRHYTNAPCRCESCANPDRFPAAVRARFPDLVLIATSDDPPELRRFEFSLEAIKPEYRERIARRLCELIKAA